MENTRTGEAYYTTLLIRFISPQHWKQDPEVQGSFSDLKQSGHKQLTQILYQPVLKRFLRRRNMQLSGDTQCLCMPSLFSDKPESYCCCMSSKGQYLNRDGASVQRNVSFCCVVFHSVHPPKSFTHHCNMFRN